MAFNLRARSSGREGELLDELALQEVVLLLLWGETQERADPGGDVGRKGPDHVGELRLVASDPRFPRREGRLGVEEPGDRVRRPEGGELDGGSPHDLFLDGADVGVSGNLGHSEGRLRVRCFSTRRWSPMSRSEASKDESRT